MFAQGAVGLWLTPFTLRYLNREEYAIFSLLMDGLFWMGVLDLGITAGLRIQASRLKGSAEDKILNELASTAFFAQAVIVIGILVFGVALAMGFPHFFLVRPELQTQAFWVCLMVMVGLAMSTGTQTFSALLVANQQQHVDNLIGLLLIGIRTVVTVVLLMTGWGLYSLAVAHLVAKMITGSLAVIRTFHLLPQLKIQRSLVSWGTLSNTARLGVWFTLGSMASILLEALDGTITAKVLSLETVTSLSLTRRLYDLAGNIVLVLTVTARPMLGQMLGQNKNKRALLAYRQLFVLSSSVAVVAALAVWSGNQCFVQQWAGAVNYAGYGVDSVLLFTVITYNWINPNQSILAANLAVRAQCLVRLLDGVLNVSLAIWLGHLLGLVGIVLGALIATTLTSVWIMPLLTARMFKRPFGEFLRDDAFRTALLLVALFPIAFASQQLAMQFGGYFGALLGMTLTGLCGLGLLWFFVLDAGIKERMLLGGSLHKILAPFKVRTGISRNAGPG